MRGFEVCICLWLSLIALCSWHDVKKAEKLSYVKFQLQKFPPPPPKHTHSQQQQQQQQQQQP